jgi:16S rRNA (uracil1498-N3)-methyltransferase
LIFTSPYRPDHKILKMEITDSLFIIASPVKAGQALKISEEEATHILNSRRLRQGETIFLTNGAGLCARGEITIADSRQHKLWVDIEEVHEFVVPRPRLVVASALPKGDRQAVLLNMATQLGMNEFIPLDCDHSVVRFQDKMAVRWRRLVAEACKQSRNCHFPVISPGRSLATLVAGIPDKIRLVVGDSRGQSIPQIGENLQTDIEALVLVVGPEGGFSDRETMLLNQQNSLKLRLSNQVLRTETAAISMIAAINQAIWSN